MNWSDMSPRERDALVAEKVMGWETCANPDCKGCEARVMLARKSDFTDDTVWVIRHPDTLELGWSPTTDISAAWEVVEKMEGTGRWLGITRHNDFWRAVMSSTHKVAPLHPSAEALIAPEAICLAALRAKGVEV